MELSKRWIKKLHKTAMIIFIREFRMSQKAEYLKILILICFFKFQKSIFTLIILLMINYQTNILKVDKVRYKKYFKTKKSYLSKFKKKKWL